MKKKKQKLQNVESVLGMFLFMSRQALLFLPQYLSRWCLLVFMYTVFGSNVFTEILLRVSIFKMWRVCGINKISANMAFTMHYNSPISIF